MSRLRINIILFLVLAFLLVGGIYLTGRDLMVARLSNLDQIAVNLSNRYVDKIDPLILREAGIRGMLSILDPYSELLEAKAYSGLLEETSGEFQGLGIEIIVKDRFLTVVSALEGTPAYRAGLLAGDRIIKIEGENAIGITSEEAVQKLRGEKGSKVRITVTRPGTVRPLEFTVTRDVIEIKAVPYYGLIGDETGYIRLKRFSEGSHLEVAEAIKELTNLNMKSLILDLRGNPGGLLSQAVEVAGLFLDGKKLIMETRGQDAALNQKFYSDNKAILPDLPLAVLVDNGSASASEIVAGAIQDWDRGVIIGDTTFGKGMVQSLLELEEGLALKLTTAKYFTPSGRCLQKDSGTGPGGLAGLDWHPETRTETQKSGQTFTTQAGRKVPGSGGIVPDILVTGRQWSTLNFQLYSQGMFFDFAVKYLSSNPEIGPALEVSEKVYQQFLRFLKEKNFEYNSETLLEIEQLKQTFKEEFAWPALEENISGLERQVHQEEINIFQRQKEELKWRIKESILVNHFGEKARYEKVWFQAHPEILRAFELLKDTNTYNSILSG
jgi:carboxyl-terminal processing protease